MSAITTEQLAVMAGLVTDAAADNGAGISLSSTKGGSTKLPKVRIEVLQGTELVFLCTSTVRYSGFAVKQAAAALPDAAGLSDEQKRDAIALVPGTSNVVVRHQFDSEVEHADVQTGSLSQLMAAASAAKESGGDA